MYYIIFKLHFATFLINSLVIIPEINLKLIPKGLIVEKETRQARLRRID